MIESNLGRRHMRLMFAWTELHRDVLSDSWKRAHTGETLYAIEPLR